MTGFLASSEVNTVSDHQLTKYESLVRETPVTPAEAGVGLTADGDSVLEDYGDDRDGHWYHCSCGEQFHAESTAWDHIMDQRRGEQ